MISEAEMLEQLRKGIEFPPLAIRLSKTLPGGRDQGIDAILEVRSEDQSFEFAAELSTRSTPRAFEDALRSVERAVQQADYYPMLVTPYLREAQLEELQQQRMSGIDLSGNGVICLPGEFFVFRTGKPNKFPDSAPTKYAYRGATSLVARAFLCRTTFDSLADIEQQVESRGGSIALSTISKALKRLESDLIVDRNGDSIRLRQPEKLLEKLADSYREPKVTRTFTGSAKQPLDKLVSLARKKADVVLSGRSSIDAYAVMGRDEWPVLYTSSIDRLIDAWGKKVEETSRFVDLELRQTDDPTVYFDARIKQNLPYASPVQVFLECSSGDKREREVATQVKDFILRQLKK
jgi:hypothetical protein